MIAYGDLYSKDRKKHSIFQGLSVKKLRNILQKQPCHRQVPLTGRQNISIFTPKNDYGFSALPGGSSDSDGSCSVGDERHWW
ncbi:MAG: hypothetical protein LBQ87_09645 [Candidatus Fibromonas sp.]|nr:hypothetical protein [Candidatus Fibromonas sp.]